MRKNSTRVSLVALVLLFSTGLFAANFTVTSNADSGPGTLRQALADANALPGTDNILFNLPGTPSTITLLSPLIVNSAVNINGYSQPGSFPNTIIGRYIAVYITAPGIDAFDINNGNVSVSGLGVYDAARAFVLSAPAGAGGVVKIWGNSIGVDDSGLPFGPIASHGIYIESESLFFTYVIPRIYIGTDGDGVNDAFEGNWITNCATTGIFLAASDNVAIAGNYVGPNAAGNNWNFGNGNGIVFDGQYAGTGATGNRIGTNGDGVSDMLERNVISANRSNGIIIHKFASANLVSGNYIGLSASGGPAGNKNGSGILLGEVTGNIIGVTPTGGTAIQANYISSNSQNGITLESGTAANQTSGNSIMGNVIGSNASNANLGNLGSGIYLQSFSDGTVISNIIGSNDDGNNDNLEGNIIAYNRRDGVGVFQNAFGTVNNNRISRNSFFLNGGTGAGLGINLLAGTNPNDDITPNDVGDGDAGPNNLFNYPELTGFGVDASMVSMFGTAPAGSLVQFYVTSTDAAPSNPNFKEGQLYLISGLDNGPDDLDPTPGTFSFFFGLGSLANPVAAGQEVNAIAISSASGAGNTSEFSQSALVILPVQFVNFDAQLQGDKVLVTWATAQEQNASHFEVQKSNDGISFATIGSVKAKGNSSSLLNYAFTDNNVAPGVSYYRLRQVDLDAKFVYTKTVTIRNEGRGKGFYAWPNPVTDVLNVTLNQTKAEKLMLRVVDFNGRTIRSNQFNTVRGINQISLNFSGLASGMYIIQVTGGESTLTQKIIKN